MCWVLVAIARARLIALACAHRLIALIAHNTSSAAHLSATEKIGCLPISKRSEIAQWYVIRAQLLGPFAAGVWRPIIVGSARGLGKRGIERKWVDTSHM